ncbi:serine/threonine protein kinase [Seongchinamella sediminis]|uniref:Serine/threonine protein kinase n=1 Tax=Seongchinamella sediminis TaxID=2283635 RepID=A0A3L7DZ91_9GAMM|nr:protein kinase [Seongchinamella sediminis]RLQ22574.1 serine/threonine protein kinase [Seongchinamella sediminis]
MDRVSQETQGSGGRRGLQHFYINEEQSIYLLSQRDARKLKQWLGLCEEQLRLLGYDAIEIIGKGAYGFVFAGRERDDLAGERQLVFKFARITLPRHVQDRLEEEAYMLSQVALPHIPACLEFQRVRGQSILVMERARGINLQELVLKRGRVEPRLVVKIAAQLGEILCSLREQARQRDRPPIIHGDIKPSNVVFDEASEQVSLIDWGAAVFAQQDANRQFTGGVDLAALSSDLQQTNAKLGDIYFIGEEQLRGGLSSPRFDEQGVAGTLYALASGQSSRFGSSVITPASLGLPVEFARTLANLLSPDPALRDRAGDYFLENMRFMKRIVIASRGAPSGGVPSGGVPSGGDSGAEPPLVPVWLAPEARDIDSVVYSSRKSFLRQEMPEKLVADVDPTELDRYYKNYLEGMGDTEKAFVIAVSHLGYYPVVGGLAIHWNERGMNIDSNLNLYDEALYPAFTSAVNNVVHLGRAITKTGVFKSCMFDARNTLHIERAARDDAFRVTAGMHIPYEISDAPPEGTGSKLHSYFEDGDDPDEMLELPRPILDQLAIMNSISHTGCIIFESLEFDLKIHNYLQLLDPEAEPRFRACLDAILEQLHLISDLGVSGFMKLLDTDTKFFPFLARQPDRFAAGGRSGSPGGV